MTNSASDLSTPSYQSRNLSRVTPSLSFSNISAIGNQVPANTHLPPTRSSCRSTTPHVIDSRCSKDLPNHLTTRGGRHGQLQSCSALRRRSGDRCRWVGRSWLHGRQRVWRFFQQLPPSAACGTMWSISSLRELPQRRQRSPSRPRTRRRRFFLLFIGPKHMEGGDCSAPLGFVTRNCPAELAPPRRRFPRWVHAPVGGYPVPAGNRRHEVLVAIGWASFPVRRPMTSFPFPDRGRP